MADLPTWQYRPRAVRRQREAESLQQLKTAVGPLVKAGDPASMARARAMTNIERRAEQTAEYRARVQARVRESMGVQSSREQAGLAAAAAPKKKKSGGGLGGVLGGLKDAAEDVGGGLADIAGGAKDLAGDALGVGAKVGGKGLKAGLTVLDAPREYVGAPAFSVLSGSLAEKRKPILDAHGNPTGRYYRSAPGVGDVGKSLLQAVTSNPIDTYEEARKANDERLADPEMNAFTRTLLQGVQDPLTYLGPGAVKGALRAAPEVVRASKAAKVAGAILEQPKAVGVGGVVGSAVGAQGAENAGLGEKGTIAATLAGGFVGGGIGGHVATRGVRQSLKDVDTGLAKVQGREGLPAAIGAGIEDVSKKPALPALRVLGKRGKGRVVGFDFDLGAEARPGATVSTPYGSVILSHLDADRSAGPQWVGKFERSNPRKNAMKSDTVLIRQGGELAEESQLAASTPAADGAISPDSRIGETVKTEPAQLRTRQAVIAEMTQAAIDGDQARVAELRQELLTAPWDEPAVGDGSAVEQGAVNAEAGGSNPPPPAKPPAPGTGGFGPDEFSNVDPERVSFDASGLSQSVPAEPEDFAAASRAAFQAEHDAELGRTSDRLLRMGINSMNLPLNLPEVQIGLTRWDKATNRLKAALGLQKYMEDPLATPAMRARRKLQPVVDSQAARFGALWDTRAKDVFERDAAGRIVNLEGTPTIQDVAARMPQYEPFLTPAQRKFMEDLRFEGEKYGDLIREAGINLATFRKDVQEGGGFYLPRGKAELEALRELPDTFSGMTKLAGVRKGFEKEATFESMTEGIKAGYKYSDFGEALSAYAKDAGRRSLDQYTSEYFKSLRHPSGQQVGLTYADRIDEQLRGAYQTKVKELASIRGRLATAERRAGMAVQESDELDTALMAFAEAADSAPDLAPLSREFEAQRRKANRLRNPRRVVELDADGNAVQLQEDFIRADTIDRVVDAFEDQFPDSIEYSNEVDAAIETTARRISALERRGLKYNVQAKELTGRLARTKKAMETLSPQYRQAVTEARKGDRTLRRIEFAPLNGRQFPIDVANAANRWLSNERPATGRGAVTLHATDAFNSLMRGLRATGDASFIGIQGLLGAIRDPIGYGRAMAVAYKGFADPAALGSYLRDFDESRAALNKPTTRDWAAQGLHIGGAELSEFAIEAKGLPALAKKAKEVQGFRQVAEGAKRSNRMFSYFGDSMRAELADTMYDAAVKSGKTVDEAAMREIANAANLMTGWSPNTFGGTLGQLALFAPRFFQSQLELVTNAVTRGGMDHSEARKTLLKMLGLAVGVTVLANEVSPDGLAPEKILSPFRDPKDPRSGFNSNFLRIRAGGVDATLLGPWDSLLRGVMATAGGLANEVPGVRADGDLTALLRTKSSPALGTAWDLLTGATIVGGKASLKDPDYMLRSLVPISASDLGPNTLTGSGALRQVVGAAGIKAAPLSAGEQLDALAQTTFGKRWRDLEPVDKNAIKEAHPDVWQRSVEAKDAKLQRVYELQEETRNEQEADNALMLSGQLDVQTWKAAAADRRTALYGATDELTRDFEESNAGNRVLNGYYQAIDASKVNGRIDWDAVDNYVSELSPADQKVIERNRGASKTPLEKAYSAVSSEYYALPKYRGLTSDEARDVDDLLAVVNQLARQDTKLAKSAVLKKAAESIGASEETVKQARRRIYGMLQTVKDRERWKAKHPESVLISGGQMTPAAVQAIQARMRGLAKAA